MTEPIFAAGYDDVRTERGWRKWLASAARSQVAAGLLDINREVRRVRALAEGRLVRETTWHVRMVAGDLSCAMAEESAREMWRHAYTTTGSVVRVTRIRRPS